MMNGHPNIELHKLISSGHAHKYVKSHSCPELWR